MSARRVLPLLVFLVALPLVGSASASHRRPRARKSSTRTVTAGRPRIAPISSIERSSAYRSHRAERSSGLRIRVAVSHSARPSSRSAASCAGSSTPATAAISASGAGIGGPLERERRELMQRRSARV